LFFSISLPIKVFSSSHKHTSSPALFSHHVGEHTDKGRERNTRGREGKTEELFRQTVMLSCDWRERESMGGENHQGAVVIATS